jgi:hypothetical protein
MSVNIFLRVWPRRNMEFCKACPNANEFLSAGKRRKISTNERPEGIQTRLHHSIKERVCGSNRKHRQKEDEESLKRRIHCNGIF